MASIASVYVDIVPSTAAIADGIKQALLDADSRHAPKAAKRWQREIDKELSDVDVTVDADTAPARKEIKKVEDGHYRAEVKVDVDQASLARAKAQLSGAGAGAGQRSAGWPKARHSPPQSAWRPTSSRRSAAPSRR